MVSTCAAAARGGAASSCRSARPAAMSATACAAGTPSRTRMRSASPRKPSTSPAYAVLRPSSSRSRNVRGHPVGPRRRAAPEVGDGPVRRVTGHRAGVRQREACREAGVAPQQPERDHALRHADAADVRPPPLAERAGSGDVEEHRGARGARGRVEHPLDRATDVQRRDLATVRVAHPVLEREQERAEVPRGVRQVAREAGHERVALRRRRVRIRERRRAGGERDAPRRGRAGVGGIERDLGRAERQLQRAARPRRRPQWPVAARAQRRGTSRRNPPPRAAGGGAGVPGALPSSTIIDEVRPRRASRDDHDRRNGTPAARAAAGARRSRPASRHARRGRPFRRPR